MDLLLDQDAFKQASRELQAKCDELTTLRANISASFEQLRKDWDSEAGNQFFARFESDLMHNLENHVKVFDYMSKNLSTAVQKYEEVFRAADTVANAQF
ncbi:MAG: WXG100 family type VII secretion target [Gracilibacteraceae bacterium]|jgi:WXG100 family type VII secretion target|nr:WXG100 family type VII secretion target [Gracilibacteraceae bacterium]